MNLHTHKKKADLISSLAMDLLHRTVMERLPSISEYQTMFHVSRGTIQNTFAYLRENHAIVLQNKGHQGMILLAIQADILLHLAQEHQIIGTMSYPDCRNMQKLSMFLYERFRNNDMSFQLIYQIGAQNRFQFIESNYCDFAICSKFAALQAIYHGRQIEILKELELAYPSQYHFVMNHQRKEKTNLYVGVDLTSIDHCELTYSQLSKEQYQILHIPSTHLLEALLQNCIDAAVLKTECINEKIQEMFFCNAIQVPFMTELSTAVIVVSRTMKANRTLIQNVLKKTLSR